MLQKREILKIVRKNLMAKKNKCLEVSIGVGEDKTDYTDYTLYAHFSKAFSEARDSWGLLEPEGLGAAFPSLTVHLSLRMSQFLRKTTAPE